MKLIAIFTFLGILSCSSVIGQTSYRTHRIDAKKVVTNNPRTISVDWQPKLVHKEAPNPGGDSFRSFLLQQKAKIRSYYQQTTKREENETNDTPPILGMGMPLEKLNFIGNGDTIVQSWSGGTPNDNTLAISNDGMLVASWNARIWAYDIVADTLVINGTSIHAFTSEFTNADKFDPKLLYDQDADRFVFVFLNGRTSVENNVIVGFSTTNNPADPWNFYAVPGNPLNNSTWTDYPAIALTKDELFLTGNLLIDNEPWQTGFDQTVVWQIDKSTGYNGDSTLTSVLWDDLKYNGESVRNMNPIQGGAELAGPNMYLLSNKNFSLGTDTIWLIEVTDTIGAPSATANITLLHSEQAYGVPPVAQQIGDNTFETNDARVLGGFLNNGLIQFVANTVDPSTLRAAVYHGFISDLNSTPKVTGNIISTVTATDTIEYGYPNIAYVGTDDCELGAMIAFNHTSNQIGAGYSAVYYGDDRTYSEITPVIESNNPVQMISGSYERWGDYFGIQRKYNEPNKVWTAGYFALVNNVASIWVNELIDGNSVSPDALALSYTVSAPDTGCSGTIFGSVSGGLPPYVLSWADGSSADTRDQLCDGFYTLQVTEDRNCTVMETFEVVNQPVIPDEPIAVTPEHPIYPNPTSDLVNIYLELANTTTITVEIYTFSGAHVKTLYADQAKAGVNEFSFSTAALSVGSYIVKVYDDQTEVISEKVIRIDLD